LVVGVVSYLLLDRQLGQDWLFCSALSNIQFLDYGCLCSSFYGCGVLICASSTFVMSDAASDASNEREDEGPWTEAELTRVEWYHGFITRHLVRGKLEHHAHGPLSVYLSRLNHSYGIPAKVHTSFVVANLPQTMNLSLLRCLLSLPVLYIIF
jgi:hypothetical protein